MCNLAMAFSVRFNDLNRLLRQVNTQNSKFCLDSRSSVREIGDLWRILNETVGFFNKIFGWPLIFFTGRLVGQLLSSPHFTMIAFTPNSPNLTFKDDTYSQHVIYANLFISIYSAVSK